MLVELKTLDECRKRAAVPLTVDTTWERSLTTSEAESEACITEEQKDVLYHLCGYWVRGVARTGAICKQCLGNIQAAEGTDDLGGRDVLTTLKDFTGSSLVYVNADTYGFFLKLEVAFRRVMKEHQHSDRVKDILQQKLCAISAPHLATCHNIREKLISRFTEHRLHTWESKKEEGKRYGSASMAQRCT